MRRCRGVSQGRPKDWPLGARRRRWTGTSAAGSRSSSSLHSLGRQNAVAAQYWASKGVTSAALLLLGAPGFNPQLFSTPWNAAGVTAAVETCPVLSPTDLQNYDFTPHITAVLDEQPDLVMVATSSFDGAKLLTQMSTELQNRPGYQPILSVDPAMLTSEFMSNVPAQLLIALQGVKPVVDATRPEYRYFDALYSRTYEESPSPGFWTYWFDPAYLIAAALTAAGSTDPRAVADQLRAVSRAGEPFTAQSFGALRAMIAAGADVDYVGATGAVDLDDFFGSSASITLRAWRIVEAGTGLTLQEYGDFLAF
jgi:hypothetical protein